MDSRYNKKYIDKLANEPLPPLEENERIYLDIPYMARGIAQASNCGFDDTRRLWFTGIHNARLETLIKMFGVNEEATSDYAKQLLKGRTGSY